MNIIGKEECAPEQLEVCSVGKNLHIVDSYKIWSYKSMKHIIAITSEIHYNSDGPCSLLNRTYFDMYIEWILHNLGYYVTKPLCYFKFFKSINLRCRDVDLEEWKR